MVCVGFADMWWLALALFLLCIIEVGGPAILTNERGHPVDLGLAETPAERPF